MQQAPCIFHTRKDSHLKKVNLFDFFFFSVVSKCIDVSDGHFIYECFKDIYNQLLNCKILSQNISNNSRALFEFITNTKQVLSKFTWHYSKYLNLLFFKLTDSTVTLLAARNR